MNWSLDLQTSIILFNINVYKFLFFKLDVSQNANSKDASAYIFCGQICSGKSKILERICASTGAIRFSTGQLIEEDLHNLGKPIDRYSMQAHGDTNPKRWANELVSRAYNAMPQGQRIFGFECPRYPEQIQILLDAFPISYVFGVKAPIEMRFEWILKRNREGDPKTIGELQEVDARDWEGYKTGIGQNTKGCFEMIERLANEQRGEVIDNNCEGENYLDNYANHIGELLHYFVQTKTTV